MNNETCYKNLRNLIMLTPLTEPQRMELVQNLDFLNSKAKKGLLLEDALNKKKQKKE